MKIFNWLAELRHRNPILYQVGMIHFVLFVICIPLALFDQRQVLGLNAWIKPLKFCISITIYTWTFGWILFDLRKRLKWIRPISWTIAISMFVEITIILYQASVGRRSHFNMDTPLDALLFGVMGLLITINTVMVVISFLLYLERQQHLTFDYQLAIQLGFVIFIIGNMVGGVMISRMSHAVGVADGGSGIPILNWSLEGGDLRISHFFGLHGIQILPVFNHYLKTKTNLTPNKRRLYTILLFTFIMIFISYTFISSMNGISLFKSFN